MPTPVFIGQDPKATMFKAFPEGGDDVVVLEPDEIEVIRLVDLEDLSQEEAGERMGISRGTIWRLLQSARRKTSLALTEGKTIIISGNHQNSEENADEN